jgi:hypothetical protein
MTQNRKKNATTPLGLEELEPRLALNAPGWVNTITNPFNPLIPGTVYFYQGTSGKQAETDIVVVTHQTKTIAGVTTTVVKDTVYVNGKKEEYTLDYFAQDTRATSGTLASSQHRSKTAT